jgi:hypothetical protein
MRSHFKEDTMKYGFLLMSKAKEKEYKEFIKKLKIRGKLYEIGDDIVDMWMKSFK